MKHTQRNIPKEASKAASLLGRRGAGIAKNITAQERQRRRERMRKTQAKRWAKHTAKLMIVAALVGLAPISAKAGDLIGYIRGHDYGPIDLYRDEAVIAKVRQADERGEDIPGYAMEVSGELIVVDARTKVRVIATKPDPIWRVAVKLLVLEGEQKGKTGWFGAAAVGDCRSCDDWKAVAQ